MNKKNVSDRHLFAISNAKVHAASPRDSSL